MTTERPERPLDQENWNQRYVDGQLPWDNGTPDPRLPRVLEQYGVAPGLALEIGCGTGTNLCWLAEQGFTVTGTDLAPAQRRGNRHRGGATLRSP